MKLIKFLIFLRYLLYNNFHNFKNNVIIFYFCKNINADKLSICKVFNGTENLKIICGASNVKKDLLTVLAPVGTVIKSGSKEEFVIKKSLIRGE